MRGSRPAGFGGVGERAARSHRSLGSVGLAAVAARVAPLVLLPARVLSSAISSTNCAAPENTAAVTIRVSV
jgi:hypothetical protein